jgi:hypothetical protein
MELITLTANNAKLVGHSLAFSREVDGTSRQEVSLPFQFRYCGLPLRFCPSHRQKAAMKKGLPDASLI